MSSGSEKQASGQTLEEQHAAERLASLQAWAEERKYVRPGEDGTLPFGVGSINALGGFGGPLRQVDTGYKGHIAPPSYETAVGEPSQPSEKKPGPVKRWLEKRKEKKEPKVIS